MIGFRSIPSGIRTARVSPEMSSLPLSSPVALANQLPSERAECEADCEKGAENRARDVEADLKIQSAGESRDKVKAPY